MKLKYVYFKVKRKNTNYSRLRPKLIPNNVSYTVETRAITSVPVTKITRKVIIELIL